MRLVDLRQQHIGSQTSMRKIAQCVACRSPGTGDVITAAVAGTSSAKTTARRLCRSIRMRASTQRVIRASHVIPATRCGGRSRSSAIHAPAASSDLRAARRTQLFRCRSRKLQTALVSTPTTNWVAILRVTIGAPSKSDKSATKTLVFSMSWGAAE